MNPPLTSQLASIHDQLSRIEAALARVLQELDPDLAAVIIDNLKQEYGK